MDNKKSRKKSESIDFTAMKGKSQSVERVNGVINFNKPNNSI